jgi:myo-inositol-1(or 4)-monophosphatase
MQMPMYSASSTSRGEFLQRALSTLSGALDVCSDLLRRAPVSGVSEKTRADGGRELVSDLDRAVERVLVQTIREAFPEVPVVAEETENDFGRLAHEWCFVIDPIDGTKELVEGRDGFSVSVALVDRRRPVLGLLDFPARGQRFTAIRGEGARLNGAPLRLPRAKERSCPLRLAVSPRQSREPRFESVRSVMQDAVVIPSGALASKVACVATGLYDGAFFLGGEGSRAPVWDYASAGLILEEAGGRFTALDGSELLESVGGVHHGGWIASSHDCHAGLVAQLSQWN